METLAEFFFGTEPIAWLQQSLGGWHPLPFRVLSLMGDTWGMLLVLGLSLWLFGRRVLYAEVIIVALSAIVQYGLSTLFQVSRPSGPEIQVFRHLEIGSLPSGHVFETVGAWGMLYALGCIPLWLAVLASALVGVARLYLGMHFVADVASAWVLGAGLVWGFRKLWPALWRWLDEGSPAVYLVLAAVASAATIAWLLLTDAPPRHYEVTGMVVGGAIALPLEARVCRYRPARSAAARAASLAIGAAGVIALLLLDRSVPPDARLAGSLTAGGAAIWSLLLAPLAFRRLGWAGRGRSPDGNGDHR